MMPPLYAVLPERVLSVSLPIPWGVLHSWALCEGTQELLGASPSGPHTSVERHLFWPAAGTSWAGAVLLSGRSKLSIRKLFPELPNPRCRDGDPAIAFSDSTSIMNLLLLSWIQSSWQSLSQLLTFSWKTDRVNFIKTQKENNNSFPSFALGCALLSPDWLRSSSVIVKGDKSGAFLVDRRWDHFIHYVKVAIKW